jgi:hypothetical protein
MTTWDGKPAMTKAEWAEHLKTGGIRDDPTGGYVDFEHGVIIDVHWPDCAPIDQTELRHSLAARLLHDQPYGYTREDLSNLEQIDPFVPWATGGRVMDAFSDRNIVEWTNLLATWGVTGEEAAREIAEIRPIASDMAFALMIRPMHAVREITHATHDAEYFRSLLGEE